MNPLPKGEKVRLENEEDCLQLPPKSSKSQGLFSIFVVLLLAALVGVSLFTFSNLLQLYKAYHKDIIAIRQEIEQNRVDLSRIQHHFSQSHKEIVKGEEDEASKLRILRSLEAKSVKGSKKAQVTAKPEREKRQFTGYYHTITDKPSINGSFPHNKVSQGRPTFQICDCDPGPIGFPGEKGSNGERGPIGPEGIKGVRGKIGLPGADGKRGLIGPKGTRGEVGKKGLRGEKGESGKMDRSGLKLDEMVGPKGSKGDPGERGEDGVPGSDGLPGFDGVDGKPGTDGLPGSSGHPGKSGKSGKDGKKGGLGERGVPGEVIYASVQGERGAKGEQGMKGNPGTPGTKGTSGNAGIKGKNGERGFPGKMGTCEKECKSLNTRFRQLEERTTGIVYTHWGSLKCNKRSKQLYYGQIASGHYHYTGSGGNYLCLPHNPKYSAFKDGFNSESVIFGSEYRILTGVNVIEKSPKEVFQKNAACSVCHSTSVSVSVMLPATVSCPKEWKKEYSGFLMASTELYARTEYICVDSKTDIYTGGGNQTGLGSTLLIVEAHCGGLNCQKYPNGREVNCVVCSF